jgi:hypothetical protein
MAARLSEKKDFGNVSKRVETKVSVMSKCWLCCDRDHADRHLTAHFRAIDKTPQGMRARKTRKIPGIFRVKNSAFCSFLGQF